ncbi:MAG: long-chain fatty acid--CoA ligase [Cytophagales bacterium]|nr:long-chain fatty acid--CoA ligase [Cytophagales bacterium]
MNYLPIAQHLRERIAKYGNKAVIKYKPDHSDEWLSISWNEMGKQIDRLATSLIEKGIKAGEKVAIFSQNMPEWTFTDLALLSIRAVPVPIYATSTSKQAEYIIRDASIRFVFAGEQEQYNKAFELLADNPSIEQIVVFDKKTKLYKNKSIYWDDFISQFESESHLEEVHKRLNDIEWDDLATLLYTSGTTGDPKGVMITQRNIMAQLKGHDKFLDLSSQDSSLCFLPLSHIFERVWDYYVYHKGMVNYFLKNPKLVAETLKETKPTVLCTVPRLYEKIYAKVMSGVENAPKLKQKLFHWAVNTGKKHRKASLKGHSSPGLNLQYKLAHKLVLSKILKGLGGRIRLSPCGGAKLSPEINEFFHNIGLNIFCGYGLTESTATLTTYLDKEFSFDTCGKPVPGAELKIGPDNEILAKGDMIMAGYYNKPEETAKVFTDDGWFRTGDAGIFDENGDIVITDRIKDLMKTSGGKYIAPQKIETLIGNDHYIQQIAVIGDQRNYVTALIVPSFDKLVEFAEQKGIKFDNVKEILNHKAIDDLFKERIDKIQKELARFEQVKKFTLLPKEFNLMSGEITPTLKLKRKVIYKRYKTLIEKMYKD